MTTAPIPTPEILWRKLPVLALAALPGTALGRLGRPSIASPGAWAAAGAAVRMPHDAPLPPWLDLCPRLRLDRMLIYNPRHLLAVLGEFVTHYNERRPRQSRQQRPPTATDTGPAVVDLACARICRRKILNGLINEYSQAA